MMLKPNQSLSFSGDSYTVVEDGERLGKVLPEPQPPESRSPKWRAVEKKAVQDHPFCAASGVTHDLQVHHKVPFHTHPELELEPTNLIVLNRTYHLIVGHLGDWKSWNVDVERDAAALYAKIQKRPYLAKSDGEIV
jgi:5-methylcytosine-specific restriction protein A